MISGKDKDSTQDEKKIEEEVPITPIQIFILIYLYSEEIKEIQKKDTLRHIQHSDKPHFSEYTYNVSISLREISLLIPSSILPNMGLNEEHIHTQLKILEYNRLLGVFFEKVQEKENSVFFITIDGIILVKQIFSTLWDKMQDKKVFEEDIDKIEGNKNAKDWLKGLSSELKRKAKDEIADIVINGVKIHGPSLIVLLINVLSPPAKD